MTAGHGVDPADATQQLPLPWSRDSDITAPLPQPPAGPAPGKPWAAPDEGAAGDRPHARTLRRRLLRLLLGVLVLVLVLTGCALGAGYYAYRFYVSNPACDPRAQTSIALGETSLVTAADGSLLGAVPAARHRQPVPLERMSRWLPLGLVAIEDHRFFQHSGVDWQGILRAAWADLRAGRVVEGGSTISQQLARNVYRSGVGPGAPRSLTAKLHEACLALKLEHRLTKRQILAEYLNQVYLGSGAYGVEAASRTYFDRPAATLDLPQAAMIAGLPQAPSGFDPFHHPERARVRRDEVLDAMLRAGSITVPQWRWARAETLGLRRGSLYSGDADPQVLRAVLAELHRRVSPREAAYGGLRVATTIDPRLQAEARAAVRAQLHDGDPAAAVVTIDPATGAVRALVSVSNTGPLEFNLAWQGHRQAGSAFKPFTFAAALERGIDPGSTYYLSAPLQYTTIDGLQWKVHNDEDAYLGAVSLDRALGHSDNTVFSRLTLDLGPAAVTAEARRLGISSPLAAVPSISLGVEPVSPLEMASAYATLAAGGVRREPTLIASIERSDGTVERPATRPGRRVLPAAVAAREVQALQGVVQWGTGTAATLGHRPVAGKTGTTSAFTDAWFVGFTPQLATAVWVGYPRRAVTMDHVHGIKVFGGTYPARIWHDFMAQALAGRPALPFPEPPPAPSWPSTPPRWRGFYQWRSYGDARADLPALAAWRAQRADDLARWRDDLIARRNAVVAAADA